MEKKFEIIFDSSIIEYKYNSFANKRQIITGQSWIKLLLIIINTMKLLLSVQLFLEINSDLFID